VRRYRSSSEASVIGAVPRLLLPGGSASVEVPVL
jgi:hypothetical protein